MREEVQVYARESLPMGQGKHSVRLYAVRMSREFPALPLPPKGELEWLCSALKICAA
ncbi:hypothetical protein I5Q82_01420 [Acutalibacter muris]|uniref:Uncharacterized protein n=1 Tax=Acutalibacter muris TaxID=1796620 RepID=A0AA92QWS6_9FIRM|nr:hypothetical protein [Acutalibacter muris]QQR30427.1 hypothetical protein I5Q82_01420 [Acutalibacter muris]